MVEGTIPHFEGRPVDSTVVKMSGQVPLDEALAETVLHMDDAVQLISMFRVVGVDHKVDPKTGQLIRVQILKPIEAALQPIDATNPADEGIVRALPYSPAQPIGGE